MGKMTVYHGSYMTMKEPATIKGGNTKDFGIGFYCTIIREQAERWAKRYDTPVVNIYTVRMNTRLKILEFKEMTEEWLDFIIDCRHGISHDYNIIIGAIAKYSVPSHWDIGKVYTRLILPSFITIFILFFTTALFVFFTASTRTQIIGIKFFLAQWRGGK